jgi:hypothetical protein
VALSLYLDDCANSDLLAQLLTLQYGYRIAGEFHNLNAWR